MVSDIKRRTLLVGAGAGALGALGIVSPAAAWDWSSTGSVAGSGNGADPAWVWDPQADTIVASLYANGQVDLVNSLLENWTRNDQPLPVGLPADLHDFIEQARQLPSWVDQAKLAKAFDFYTRKGLYLGVLYGMGSGMMSCAIPREARAVYYSAGGADMKDRIAKTATLGYDIGEQDAYAGSGSMIVTCIKTRLVHAAVRHLLPQSNHWQGAADETIPISQADIMVTWHSLATFAYNKIKAWKIKMTSAEADAFLHLWQITAHMLGVEDQYIPATWATANTQSTYIVDPILAPTYEGKQLSKELMNLAAEYDQGMTKPMMHAFARYTLGNQIADWIAVPREPAMDAFVSMGWPPFVAFREGMSYMPWAPPGYWTFDEFLRLAVLFFLGEGQDININLPSHNNPNYD
ncbi:MAG TPA: oxygenase MpaB family protein [Aeromicrobium sp.]|nr:oxygenase MpaB family protein [Aeromicrobium sp.]